MCCTNPAFYKDSKHAYLLCSSKGHIAFQRDILSLSSKAVCYTNIIKNIPQSKVTQCLCSQDRQKHKTEKIVWVFLFLSSLLPRKYAEYTTTQLKMRSQLELVSLILQWEVRIRIFILGAVLNHTSEKQSSLAGKFCPQQQPPHFSSWVRTLGFAERERAGSHFKKSSCFDGHVDGPIS